MVLKQNALDVNTYLSLRKKVNWKQLTEKQAQMALNHSILTVTAYDEDKPVGMGRLVGDQAVICYIQDLIVIPDYQSKGIGRLLMEYLMKYVKNQKVSDDAEMMLGLMCAMGREEFYQKFGFTARPTDTLGPGMIQYL